MNNPLENFQSGIEKKWISIKSNLDNLKGEKSDIKLEIMDDGMPKAMAFFDIDGTLEHLSNIHGKAIQKLFDKVNPEELEETYYKGFKLGNSYREFDRMIGIYEYGKTEWKDPEVYIKERLKQNQREIDEPGNQPHDIASKVLKLYGLAAGKIAEELYKEDPKHFQTSKIEPIFKLAKMYSRLGIPIVGFTANEKSFVQKLAKYSGLSEVFIDIATDEDMAGGGKEISIEKLINKMEEKGIRIPKDRLIFVGDSLRGDIGVMIKARMKDSSISGQGILVLNNKEELFKIKRQISEDKDLKNITSSIDVNAVVVDDVPLDENGSPMLLSRFRRDFMEKL